MDTSDKELLALISQKDQRAYNELYKRYRRLFYDLSFSYTHDKDASDDINQIFWVGIWLTPEVIKTDAADSAKSFLYKHFSFCVFDYFKSAAARQTGGTEELLDIKAGELSYSHVLEEMEMEQAMELLEKTIAEMPELTREVFIRRWEKGCSTAQTARQLAVSEQTVRTQYNRGIQSVRNKFKRFALHSLILMVFGISG